MRKTSIKNRLIIFLFCAIAIGLVLGNAVQIFIFRTQYMLILMNQGYSIASSLENHIIQNLKKSPDMLQDPSLHQILDGVQTHNPEILSAMICNNRGQILLSSRGSPIQLTTIAIPPNLTLPLPHKDIREYIFTRDNQYFLSKPLFAAADSTYKGSVVLIFSEYQMLKATEAATRHSIAASLTILLLIVCIFTAILLVRINRPLKHIQNAFEQAKDGLSPLALDLPEIHQFREFDTLCSTFSTLYQELELKQEQIQRHSLELEHTVAVRTWELETANQTLKETIGILNRIKEQDQQLQAELERSRKLEAVGNLASGVAHDLNNILSSFVNYPELMLMELPDDSPVINHIHAIKKAGERASSMVQDLMTLARKGVALNMAINTDVLFDEFKASPECQSLALTYPKTAFNYVREEHLPNLYGIPFHITKAFMNLITNAAEAINGSGTVEFRAQTVYLDAPHQGYETIPAGSYLCFSVSDTGVGMDHQTMERIFEPFFTKKTLGRRSGTGLGMSVVYSTVKEHAGFIEIESNPGKGSRFSLFFPPTDEIAPQAKAEVSLLDYRGRGQTILVVDDLQEQRDLATQVLRQIGYKAIACSSGETAIEYISYNKVDLVILDMLMDPGMDGYETYQHISRIHPGLPVIIASGYAENDRIHELRAQGVKGYLKKPYRTEELGLALRTTLDRS